MIAQDCVLIEKRDNLKHILSAVYRRGLSARRSLLCAMSVADLYRKHESFAINQRIVRTMYQVRYIETLDAGLTDMLGECNVKGLEAPLLEEVPWRFWVWG